jgi:hypothetical protein
VHGGEAVVPRPRDLELCRDPQQERFLVDVGTELDADRQSPSLCSIGTLIAGAPVWLYMAQNGKSDSTLRTHSWAESVELSLSSAPRSCEVVIAVGVSNRSHSAMNAATVRLTVFTVSNARPSCTGVIRSPASAQVIVVASNCCRFGPDPARRRLPMVEIDPNLELIGPDGPVTLLDAFEGRRQLIAYYFMWHPGHPAPEQCEGCTWVTTQVAELSYLHSRDITYAVVCQGPYDEGSRYKGFMGWDVPWYSAQASIDALLVGRHVGMMHIVCYLRDADPGLRDLLDDLPRRRGDGLQLRTHGPHRLRTPGAVGGLAPRLATTVASRRLQHPDERTPHRPVVATRSWTL